MKALVKGAKGVLMMQAHSKAGFIGAARYGERVLHVDGATVGCYNFAALSWGFQAGVDKVSMIILCNTEDALTTFRKNPGFETMSWT